ncbi:MAG: T9SS type A sorting domain-containing protein [Candidatus Krumholzibacteriaceae bacterium]|jgi:predicted lipoprotein with Yx(FWY)xxD motif
MSRLLKPAPLVVLCVLVIAAPSVWANWVQDGVAICTATGNQQYPMIASDGAGGAIFTWQDQRSGNYDVYVQRVNASGTVQWTADGVAVCAAAGDQYAYAIASDGAGGAIVGWFDNRSGSYDIYAQRVDASGAAQWTANGVALCTAAGTQYSPAILSDGAGGAIVTWYDHRSGNYDIYAQRVNASGTVQWTANGVALCTAARDQYSPIIASDGAGGAIVSWYDQRSGNYDIYAQRVNASGAVQWTADGVALCAATGDQCCSGIVSDDAGGAIVTWYDQRSANYDIYAQRVNASGSVQWTVDGVALCTATGDQMVPSIASDGAGGAIVAWHDYRSGADRDVYAQKVNASGAAQWTANGVPLCTAYGDDYYPVITSDGMGGAVVAWFDIRSGYNDIYAQRVNASGAVQWTANGVGVCTATQGQAYPAIVSDGASGAIVTWQDLRNGANWDIYAMRVDANGFPVLTAAETPKVLMELHQNYPNPFNPATTVAYSVPEKCNVTLKIYDVSGKCVARLVDKQQEKGSYSVAWNGKDETGNSMASGIYLYRLAAGEQTISKKMVLLR